MLEETGVDGRCIKIVLEKPSVARAEKSLFYKNLGFIVLAAVPTIIL